MTQQIFISFDQDIFYFFLHSYSLYFPGRMIPSYWKKKRKFLNYWIKYFQQASLHELGFWKPSSIIIKSKIYSTKRTYCSSTTKVFTVNTTQMLFTTDIDIIGHHSYHKGLLVSKLCKVWHAFEIEKPIINRLVYPVYTWVKCTKFKLSVSIYITYQWIFMW